MAQTLEKLFLTKIAAMPKEEVELAPPLKDFKPAQVKKPVLPGSEGGGMRPVRSMSVTSSTSDIAADMVSSPTGLPTQHTTPVASAAMLPKKKQGVKRKLADTTTPANAAYDSDQVRSTSTLSERERF
jgi:hypothetical protein